MALLKFHERRLAKECDQDLLRELLGHESSEGLYRLRQSVQVLESWILEHDWQFDHRLDSWTLDIIQVLSIDLRQVREDSQ